MRKEPISCQFQESSRKPLFFSTRRRPSASVYTYNGALKRKLTGLCHTRPTEARLTKDDERGGLTFEVPKRWIKVNAGPVYTEEQRQAMKERARAISTSKSSTAVE